MAATQNFPQDLLTRIEQLLPAAASGDFCVAFSGGLDSTALLHAMTMLVRERPRWRLRACHIDHQLQPASSSWYAHCADLCARSGVSFVGERVACDPQFADGVEAAARLARYRAFKRQLLPGETLLTAHHADDQLETVLLALLRGAGINGLAAMPAIKEFAAGWHMRPMLQFTRAAVHSWARDTGLSWLTDPSNQLARFDRNYLRHEVLPALQRRWPAAAASVTRSATHVGEARELLESLAAEDLRQAAVGPCLDMRVLRELPAPRRRQLLRYWLANRGARMPSTRKLAALTHDVLTAHSDRTPQASWDDVEVRRHGELLYCERSSPPPDVLLPLAWSWAAPLVLPGNLGQLRIHPARGTGLARNRLPPALQLRFRRGGERLQLAGHSHRSQLKNLLQEARILPWWRDRLPFLYVGDKLAAVADLWVAAEFSAGEEEQAIQVLWEFRPRVHAEILPSR